MVDFPYMRSVALRMGQSFGEDRISIFAGYVAFTAILALFPFVIFLVALAGFLGGADLAHQIIERGFAMLPPEVMNTLAPVVKQTMDLQSGKLLTFGIVGTLWATTSGVESLRDGLNVAHQLKESRPFWKRRLQSIAFVIFGSIGFLVLAVLLIALPVAIHWFTQHSPIDPKLLVPIQLVRLLVALGLLTGGFLVAFRLLPDTTYRLRALFPGALLAAFLWMALASAYSLYLSRFGNYNVTYGSLGGILATMAFFQLSITVILIGAEFNAALHFVKQSREDMPSSASSRSALPQRRPQVISTNNAS